MTRHFGQRQQAAGRRPVTWRLAMGGFAAMAAALAIASLSAAGAAAAGSPRGASGPAAASSGGMLRAWGLNSAGQLGDGTATNRAVPVTVRLRPGTKITAIRAGCTHSLALTSTGKVLAWGNGADGELGGGTSADSETPIQVMLPAVKAISAGNDHSLALTTTGQVLAWGLNDHGQLGDGTTGTRSIPVKVKLPPGTKVTAIAAGFAHALALTSTGKVFAWGDDSQGQLGNGSTVSSDTPVQARLPRGLRVAGLFAGCEHTLALTTAGEVLAWGFDGFGQLGNGITGGSSDVPVRTRLQGAKVTALSAGCFHSLALTSSGHVLAWGLNRSGELGIGDSANTSDIPVRVKLSVGLSAVGIGSGPNAHDSLAIVRKARP